MSRIDELPPLNVSADVMALARENCAANLRGCGYAAEADAFECAERDQSWAMRHEVGHLLAETSPAA
jgi:hypothetical protein